MHPIHLATAREEMNRYLHDHGINGRTVTLIDACIAIWIGLESNNDERDT